MALKILLRILFVVFAAWFSLQALEIAYRDVQMLEFQYAVLYTAVAALVASLVVFFEWRFQRQIARELVAVVFGTAVGLIVSVLIVAILIAFLFPVRLDTGGDMSLAFGEAFWRVQPWIPLVIIACCYIAISTVLQTKDDFRFLVPYIDFSQRGTQEGGVVLDTSVLIDGRVLDLVETRLISVPLIIPDFVVRELQTIADGADRIKRQRGRRGLDMVAKLQKVDHTRVVVRTTDARAEEPVDDLLVRLAKELRARIMTTDFNLNKVSQIEGVTVINVNDISNAVKPAVIPGENLRIRIIRPGQEEGQGVGYLDDGTMVVVENGRGSIDQEVAITVTGSIQTSAGRMIFGRLAE